MKYMLDTNICIFAIKHKPPALIRNFLQHDPDDLCISAITYAELMHGVEKSQSTAQNRAAITLFLSAMAILSFDDARRKNMGKSASTWSAKARPSARWIR